MAFVLCVAAFIIFTLLLIGIQMRTCFYPV